MQINMLCYLCCVIFFFFFSGHLYTLVALLQYPYFEEKKSCCRTWAGLHSNTGTLSQELFIIIIFLIKGDKGGQVHVSDPP